MAHTRSICTAAAPYLAESLVPKIIGSIAVLTILAVVAVILRFLARSLTTAPYDTTVSSGIWLNVEISIGILSASLPSMRPLFSRAIPSQIRSRFSKSRHTGTQRLQDVEGVNSGKISGSRGPHSKGLSDSGIYQGQNKQQPHKSWYNAGARVTSKRTGRHSEGGSEEGSEEDMVPMGKIHVKHDMEWEQERGPGSISQGGGTPDTLG
ncbi:MAG: hypothetical protein L6R38_001890 [Xanthoria sp. 2 TBL-2021]|nr:MAG: hypothetical protein L6R38_001890 [Xanthoria sp. 2 TBL-2021]